MSDIFLKPYRVIPDGIHDRYFERDENVQLKQVWEKFMGGQFEQQNDGLKMALVLIASNVLFRQDLRRKVSLWLFALVEDLESFNSFPWGRYVYMMTIHYLSQGFRSVNASRKVVAHYNLYGFPWVVLFVPLNYDDGEQWPNDDADDDGNDDNDNANDGGQSQPKQMKRKMSPQKEKRGGRIKRTRTSSVMSPVI
ncbi:hypothetical protein Ddye_021679 [Dipteronia dyeriana]|uniref:DUF1985 domain-containing protein n=1 Tax=Dipteronia dyeriana TaxID=168575 RepID=A0AAD9WWH7_9ROSI|nr:hypothetical protein Ddye_021679 [Dipteronia dyeriana]